MKKFITCLLIVSMVLSIVACGGNGSDTTNQNKSSGQTEQSGGEVVVKFAHDYTTNSPYHKAAEFFKKTLEEKTNGEMKVEIYPAQQLGSAREMIEGMQMGNIELVWTPTAKFAGFDQKLTLLDLPYLFPNEDIMWEALEGEIGEMLVEGLEKIGIKGLTFNAEGYKHFTANKAIESPEDLKGMKIRTMEAPVIMDMFKAWGANPVPIDFAEVYNSLQQNVVDGEENPIISIHDMKFYEVQKNISLSDHAYLTYFLSASSKWFDGLSEAHQKAVIDTSLEMQKYHRKINDEAVEGYLKNMEEYGIVINEITPENREKFKELTKPLYDQYRNEIGGELIDAALEFGESRVK